MLSLHDHAAWYETFKKNATKGKGKHGKGKDNKQNQPNDSSEGAYGQSNVQKLVLNYNMKDGCIRNGNTNVSAVFDPSK
eukprot:15010043-Ditylum_brightwellii.AAC.1